MQNVIKNHGFSKRLKELRLEAALTQKQLAEAIGVSANTVLAWERGLHDVKSDYILKLARFFKVRCNYLLGIDENRV